MRKETAFLKSWAVVISASLFVSQTVFVHAAETIFWKERNAHADPQSPTQLAGLPSPLLNSFPASFASPAAPALSNIVKRKTPPRLPPHIQSLYRAIPALTGTVRDVSIPGQRNAGKTVVYIQDVHLHPEAQKNISRTVLELIRKKKVDLVALEGVFKPLKLNPIKQFDRPDMIHKVADYLFKENRISGAVYAALTGPAEIPLFTGVDDRAHYQANVAAYQKSVSTAETLKGRLSSMKRNIEAEKAGLFNPALAAFDARVQARRDGTLSLGPYVDFISSMESVEATDVDVFLTAWKMEAALNFDQVEKERVKLLKELVRQAGERQISGLVRQSLAYRTGWIGHAEFYEQIRTLCGKSGIRLSRYPFMNDYIQYVLLSDSIKPKNLTRQINEMEQAVYASLIQTADERALVQQTDQLYLTGKLVDFALTTEEWKSYLELSKSQGRLTKAGDLSAFEAFYAEAEARDKAISANLLSAMNKENAQTAVLVTGGFHTSGINRYLDAAGVATLVFSPKMSEIKDETGAAYLSVFAQEKTPLDKLFEGDKLFVTPNPAAMGLLPLLTALGLEAENPRRKLHDPGGVVSQLEGRNHPVQVETRDLPDGAEALTTKGRLRVNRELTRVTLVPAVAAATVFGTLGVILFQLRSAHPALLGPWVNLAGLIIIGGIAVYFVRTIYKGLPKGASIGLIGLSALLYQTILASSAPGNAHAKAASVFPSVDLSRLSDAGMTTPQVLIPLWLLLTAAAVFFLIFLRSQLNSQAIAGSQGGLKTAARILKSNTGLLFFLTGFFTLGFLFYAGGLVLTPEMIQSPIEAAQAFSFPSLASVDPFGRVRKNILALTVSATAGIGVAAALGKSKTPAEEIAALRERLADSLKQIEEQMSHKWEIETDQATGMVSIFQKRTGFLIRTQYDLNFSLHASVTYDEEEYQSFLALSSYADGIQAAIKEADDLSDEFTRSASETSQLKEKLDSFRQDTDHLLKQHMLTLYKAVGTAFAAAPGQPQDDDQILNSNIKKLQAKKKVTKNKINNDYDVSTFIPFDSEWDYVDRVTYKNNQVIFERYRRDGPNRAVQIIKREEVYDTFRKLLNVKNGSVTAINQAKRIRMDIKELFDRVAEEFDDYQGGRNLSFLSTFLALKEYQLDDLLSRWTVVTSEPGRIGEVYKIVEAKNPENVILEDNNIIDSRQYEEYVRLKKQQNAVPYLKHSTERLLEGMNNHNEKMAALFPSSHGRDSSRSHTVAATSILIFAAALVTQFVPGSLGPSVTHAAAGLVPGPAPLMMGFVFLVVLMTIANAHLYPDRSEEIHRLLISYESALALYEKSIEAGDHTQITLTQWRVDAAKEKLALVREHFNFQQTKTNNSLNKREHRARLTARIQQLRLRLEQNQAALQAFNLSLTVIKRRDKRYGIEDGRSMVKASELEYRIRNAIQRTKRLLGDARSELAQFDERERSRESKSKRIFWVSTEFILLFLISLGLAQGARAQRPAAPIKPAMAAIARVQHKDHRSSTIGDLSRSGIAPGSFMALPQQRVDLERLSDIVDRSFELEKRNEFDPDQTAMDLADLGLPAGPVGVEGRRGLFNLSTDQNDRLAELVRKKMRSGNGKGLSWPAARGVLFDMDRVRLKPIQEIVGHDRVGLDVRVQERADVPLAAATIKATLDQIGTGNVFVPVKSELQETLSGVLDEVLGNDAARVIPIIDEGGFYADGVFNLDLFLSHMTFGQMAGTFIAIQGDYYLSEATWAYFQQPKSPRLRLIVLSDWLSGVIKAVEVDHRYLRQIDGIARPAIFA